MKIDSMDLSEVIAQLGDVYEEAASAIDAYPGSEHFHTSLHGAAHSKRVLLFALLIADAMELPEDDKRTLAMAAVYHDTQRHDDWLDVGHGARAADAYLEDNDKGSEQDRLIAEIMHHHDLDDEIGEARIESEFGGRGVSLLRIFKDADGLDRFRLGPDALDGRFLRTREAKELIELSRHLNGRDSLEAESKSALVVIDVQNDFTKGALGNPDAASKVPGIVAKAATFDGEVFLTQDTHTSGYLNTEEGRNLPVEHCIEGTLGWRLVPELESLADEHGWKVYKKPTFGSIELARDLAKLHEQGKLDSVEFAGFCTDICVVSNALLIKAFAPELKVSVNASLCSGATRETHASALETMRSCQIEIKKI